MGRAAAVSTVLLLVAIPLAASARKENYPFLLDSQLSDPEKQQQQQQSAQTLDCYDLQGQGGDSIQAIDYIPDLAAYGFDNMISSCCFQGIWMLYDNTNFNEDDFFVR